MVCLCYMVYIHSHVGNNFDSIPGLKVLDVVDCYRFRKKIGSIKPYTFVLHAVEA